MNSPGLEQGKKLIKLARKTIEYGLLTGQKLIEKPEDPLFLEDCGVFVTLHSYPSLKLRGCIGFPEAVMPLYKAVIEAAVNAAFRDPRFPSVTSKELDKIIIEVSVLTSPKKIIVKNREELKEKIEVGRHGLIMRNSYSSGLLLPQVPVELKWNSEEFLENTCEKAGLEKDCWKKEGTEVYSFEAIVFSEKEPKGEAERKTSRSSG